MRAGRPFVPLLIALSLFLVGTAGATVVDKQYSVRVIENPDGLVAKEPCRVVLGLAAAQDLLIQDVSLIGKGWTVSPAFATQLVTVKGGEEIRWAFDLVPDGRWNDLTLSFEINGHAHTKQLTLAPTDTRMARGEGTLEAQDEPVLSYDAPVLGASSQVDGIPPMTPAMLAKYGTPLEPVTNDKSVQGTHTVTVFGDLFFDYAKEDGPVLDYPVFGATVQIIMTGGLTLFPVPVAVGVTDRDGHFSLQFDYFDDIPFQLQMHCIAGNGAFVVMEDNIVREIEYHWSSAPVSNNGNYTLVDFGRQKARGGYIGALNIIGSLSRAYSFLCETSGSSSLPYVDVWWPTSSGPSHYTRQGTLNPTPDIYIRNTRSWVNSTHIHEYGHHFIYKKAVGIPGEYCNPGDYCDDDPDAVFLDDCGHCGWCPERDTVAFSEGFPHWVSSYICLNWARNDPPGPPGARWFKNTTNCDKPPYTMGEPWITEGFFAAVLHDITSEGYHNDDNFEEWGDNLTADPSEVVQVVIQDLPIRPSEFLAAFHARYPQYGPQFWETCYNNGYGQIDGVPPVTGTLSSVSHPLNVPSPGDRIGVDITSSTDDFSGVGGFNLTWNADVPLTPPAGKNRDAGVNHIFTDQLPPGTYYLTVRAVDRAGNWSIPFRTYGPAIIREREPSDLLPEPWTADWPYALIPQKYPVESQFAIPAETTPLYSSTYWNACVANDGEVAVTRHDTHLLVDGVDTDSYTGLVNPWGDHAITIDNGPVHVTAGRHTFEIVTDYGETVPEDVETNNAWAKQWIWLPGTMSPTTTYGRNSPPARTAGWESVTDVAWYNCYGMRVRTQEGAVSSSWAAVWMRTDDPAGDVDVRLHDVAASATSGFGGNLGWSGRPAGCLDAVLVNAANRPANYYDVGFLTSASEEPEAYDTKAVYGTALTENVARAGTLINGEGLDLYTFDPVPNVLYTVTVEYDPVASDPGPLWLTRYDNTFTTGDLMDYDAIAVTDSTRGLVHVFEMLGAPQTVQGFAVWRDNGENTYVNQGYTIKIFRTPPDLASHQPVGWSAPLVPRPEADATYSWAPQPDHLTGDQQTTYINHSMFNLSNIVANYSLAATRLDGVQVSQQGHGPLLPGEASTYLATVAHNVRGGRHTLALIVDATDLVAESKEYNNDWGAQFVWQPSALGFNYKTARVEPPETTSDWHSLDPNGIHWYNCDGIRSPTWAPSGNNHHWGALAIVPSNAGDIDVELHEQSTGPSDGFAAPLAASRWGAGETDFVLMNFRNTPTRSFDAGIVRRGLSTGGHYFIGAARSTGLPPDPDGGLGTFTMNSWDIVQLYEIDLTQPATYTASLAVADPGVDLGFSVYGPDLVHGNKSDIKDGVASSWLETGGGVDNFEFTVEAGSTGHHCLAVWKVGFAEESATTEYTLTLDRALPSAVPAGIVPGVTRLTGVYPNPFNPQTTIRFDLAAPTAVQLAIYDLTGARIAVLVAGELASGSHAVTWKGRDGDGLRLASGTYFAHLQAGGVRETRKLVLIK